MKTIAMILVLLGSGCVHQQLAVPRFNERLPNNYYQYQVSDHPSQLFDVGTQVVPLVEQNCQRVKVRSAQSWRGNEWRTVCQ